MARFYVLGSYLLLCVFSLVHAEEQGKRLAIPSAADQKKVEKLILEIFQEDLDKAKDSAARIKLANLLLQQGRETKDDAAARYVLYRYAVNLAEQAGEAPLALSAVGELAREFEGAELELKAATLARVVPNLTAVEPSKALVELTLNLVSEALEADNYAAALELGKVAEVAAIKSKVVPLVTSVRKKNEEIVAAQKSFALLQGFLDQLKKTPDDPDANLELGKYFALVKGKWDRGLPLLAKGGDKALKALAVEDLARPKEGKAQLAVADGWWDLANGDKVLGQAQLLQRAAYWYEQASGGLTGLSRTKALKRLEQIGGKTQVAPIPIVGNEKPGLLKVLEGHGGEIKSVAFSPDGKYALSGAVDDTMRLWDIVTGKESHRFTGHKKQVWGVTFVPGGKQVVSASWDGTVKLWDITGKEVRTFPHPIDCNGVAVSKDGKYLLTGCDDHHMRLWDLNTAQELKKYLGSQVGTGNYCYGVAFSPDGKYVASGSADKIVRIYERDSGNRVREITSHTNAVPVVVFSPDSKYLFTCGDNAAHQWNVETAKEVKRFEPATAGYTTSLALSSDGKRLVTGHEDRSVRVWDVASGKELERFQGHNLSVGCVAISQDGRRALSGSLDQTVRVWVMPN